MLDRFGYYVNERHAMYLRRLQGLGPRVTDDPILRDNHFTNVYRELDTGTIFAHRMMAGLSRSDAIWFTVAYRLINRWQTVEEFGRVPTMKDVDEWQAYLDERYTSKKLVKTSRHLCPHRAQYKQAILDVFDLNVPRDHLLAWKALRTITGVGDFIGWQVYCDLVEEGLIDYEPNFVVCGDGASFAIAVLQGQRTWDEYRHTRTKRVTIHGGLDRRYVTVIHRLRDTQTQWLPATWDPMNRPLDAKNIEHALCEWTRYEKLLHKVSSVRDA